MGISNVGGVGSTSYTSQTNKTRTTDKTDSTAKENTSSSTNKTEDSAAIYESSYSSKTTSKKENAAIVDQLKADLQQRQNQLTSMVQKMLSKQGQKYQSGINIYSIIKSGNLKVDAETAAKAQADIAEDGYWGVNQTSDRMLSFAKALSNNDPAKADEMLNAFKKGFEQATKAWGGKLPDICQKTYDATLKKFDEWKNSQSSSTETE